MFYLDDWALLEREHSSFTARAIEALEFCTLRLPVTGAARVDNNSLKDVCTVLDVMLSMGASRLMNCWFGWSILGGQFTSKMGGTVMD
ncbi:hypothetical protein MKW98_023121 [Papaver atlanticum]|uniref:Uncharacterized protein n=1 Tax=Papaver atlanticum TaxID=357466 RepID=A0AAD4XT69_9MAGN|nr:hypothetical protein MKW98_023121 [Papaver atlanticum]